MIEFNLSEKIKELFEVEYLDTMSDVQGDVSNIFREFIKKLKENKRFKQLGKELRDELNIQDAQKIQQIQLMFTELLLEIDKLAGDDLIQK